MTERLYYDKTYLQAFDAVAGESEARADGVWLTLDRSAFYPTSGGQPFDTGRLSWTDGQARVADVEADARGVWHRLEGGCPAPGTPVHGEIDWARRFDHMQQHGGEHMLAGTIWRRLRGFTIGLHLGADFSTIDVELPGGRTRLTDAETVALEDEVNGLIQRDAPCRCWFPGPEELAALPLRKAPAVTEHVRIVAFGDFEMCACGGTHPASSGQVGFLKILETAPARGKMRVSFVCGMRALRYAQGCCRAAQAAGALLSCGPEEVPSAVTRLKETAASEHAALKALRRESALARVPALLEGAEALPGGALVCACLPEADRDTLRDVAAALIVRPDVIALLAAPGEKECPLVFARGEAAKEDMGRLLRAAGAKGGGRPDFAQGSAPDAACLDAARRLLGAAPREAAHA